MHDDELMSLWQRARCEALRRCAGSLARLRRGEGGFYEADDLWQDLFIAFWGLTQAWSALPARREEELWAAWERVLWGGARKLLRRRPLRFGQGRERAVAPDCLALDDAPWSASATPPSAALPPATRAALTQDEDAEAAQAHAARLDALETALWSLAPAQRQVLYLSTVADLSAAQVACCLGLESAEAVHARVHAARVALRRRLGSLTAEPQSTQRGKGNTTGNTTEAQRTRR